MAAQNSQSLLGSRDLHIHQKLSGIKGRYFVAQDNLEAAWTDTTHEERIRFLALNFMTRKMHNDLGFETVLLPNIVNSIYGNCVKSFRSLTEVFVLSKKDWSSHLAKIEAQIKSLEGEQCRSANVPDTRWKVPKFTSVKCARGAVIKENLDSFFFFLKRR